MKVNVTNFNGRLRKILIGSLPSIKYVEKHTGKPMLPLMRKIHEETMEDLQDLSETLKKQGVDVRQVACESFDEELNLGQSMFVIDDCVLTSWHTDTMDRYGFDNLRSISADRPFYFNSDNLLLTKDELIIGHERDWWKIDRFGSVRPVRINPSYHGGTTGFISNALCLSYDSIEKTRKIYNSLENIDLKLYFKDARNIIRNWNTFSKLKTDRCTAFDNQKDRSSMGRFFLGGDKIELIEQYQSDFNNIFETRLFDCRFIIIDKNTIVSNTKHDGILKELDNKNIEVIHTNWRHGVFFDNSLRHISLAMERDEK